MSRVAYLSRRPNPPEQPQHRERRDPSQLKQAADAFWSQAERDPGSQRYHELHRQAQILHGQAIALEEDD